MASSSIAEGLATVNIYTKGYSGRSIKIPTTEIHIGLLELFPLASFEAAWVLKVHGSAASVSTSRAVPPAYM